jgi:hypothetical protein
MYQCILGKTCPAKNCPFIGSQGPHCMDVVAAWQGTSRGGTLQVSAGTATTAPGGHTAHGLGFTAPPQHQQQPVYAPPAPSQQQALYASAPPQQQALYAPPAPSQQQALYTPAPPQQQPVYTPPPLPQQQPPLFAVPISSGSSSPGPPHHLFRPYGQPVTTNNYFYADPAQGPQGPQAPQAPAAQATAAPGPQGPQAPTGSWSLWQWLLLGFVIVLTILVLVHVCLTGKLSRRRKKLFHGAGSRV